MDGFEDEDSATDSDVEVDEMKHEDRAEALRKELADVPLGDLQKLKGTIGLKQYNESIFGASKSDLGKKPVNLRLAKTDDMKLQNSKDKNSAKVKGKKSEPEEKSSKIKTFGPRKVIAKSGRLKRDPRFDDLSGHYNEDLFEKTYTFVNDMRQKEMDTVKKELKKVKNKEKKDELQKLYQRMEQQEKIRNAKQMRKEKEKVRKKEELESVKQGKTAFYLKKSDKKKIDLAEKFRELKSSGQLTKYMGKKHKRNAAKEKKKLPFYKSIE